VTEISIDDGLLIKQADGRLQDTHGQAWKFPAQGKCKGERGGLLLSLLQLAHLAIMMLFCCGVCLSRACGLHLYGCSAHLCHFPERKPNLVYVNDFCLQNLAGSTT
jgi:hypothetical protein